MNNPALEHARRHLQSGIQDLLIANYETNFLYGVELAAEVIDSDNGAESIIAKNIILTCLAKMLEATLHHLDNSKQPSGDFLSSVMRTLWQLSEMKLPFDLDFMEIWNQIFPVSLEAGVHMKVNEKEKVMLKKYIETIKEKMLNERTEQSTRGSPR